MALILQHEDAVMRGGLFINLSMGILGRRVHVTYVIAFL